MHKTEYIAWFVCLILGGRMLMYQGYVGGKMVFDLGAGVKPMEPIIESEGGESHSHDHGEGDRKMDMHHSD